MGERDMLPWLLSQRRRPYPSHPLLRQRARIEAHIASCERCGDLLRKYTGLKRLPAERIYQVWFVRAGASTVTGGTFNVDARGWAWVSVDTPVPFDEVREIAVTEELAPRSITPTGSYLLVARSWR